MNDSSAAVWYVVGYIGVHPVNFLIDSGAQISLINKSEYDKLSDKCKGPLQRVKHSLSAANGDNIHVYGQTTLRVVLDRIAYQCTLIVADMGNLPGLLGLNFLKENDAILHCATGDLQLGAHQLQCGPYQLGKGGRLVVKEPVSLPARHVCLIKVNQVRWGPWNQGQLVLQPLESVCQHQQVLIPRGVLDADQKELVIQVTNPGDQNIQLPAGLPLAELEEAKVLNRPARSSVRRTNTVNAVVPRAELPEHLQEVVNRIEGLTDRQKVLLEEVLHQYEHCFEGGKYGLGRTTLVTHKIDTGDHKPVKIPPRRYSWAQKKAIREEVDKMLKQGVIEHSRSPWSSPPVLVKKKGTGNIRFCVDYRALNARTKKDAYPLPRIDDCLDALAGAKWFSTLDLAAGYWQIGMDEADKEKTAFSTAGVTINFLFSPLESQGGRRRSLD